MKVVVNLTDEMWRQVQNHYIPDGIIKLLIDGVKLPDTLNDETDVDEVLDIIKTIYKGDVK